MSLIRFLLPQVRLLSSLPQSATQVIEIKHGPVIIPTNQDMSDVNPPLEATYNIASYVNKSYTLQSLVNMNVDISKIEKKPQVFQHIMKLDFEKDIKPHIFFLNNIINSDDIIKLLSKNPLILKESLDDLQVRINYLVSKKFTNADIISIIARNPYWLMFSTQRIDKRLGFFQNYFKLSGEEVRKLSALQPKIITYNLHHIKTNTFQIKEEMGFEETEVKNLLLFKPKLWLLNPKSLRERFNYIHNVMKIPHHVILKYHRVLECRLFKIKQRHSFLEKLGRAQYDPHKENYVPVYTLVEGTDAEFCRIYAKSNVSDFNAFLKTM